jgi:hypothetical protein
MEMGAKTVGEMVPTVEPKNVTSCGRMVVA